MKEANVLQVAIEEIPTFWPEFESVEYHETSSRGSHIYSATPINNKWFHFCFICVFKLSVRDGYFPLARLFLALFNEI